jgi:hypothetical protein
MTASRILTTKHADLVPASDAGREKLAQRESTPKNTVSSTEITKLIGRRKISSEALDAGLLRDIALRISKRR